MPLAGFAALLLLLAGAVTPAEAQSGKKLKNALKQNAEDKAVQAAARRGGQTAIDGATTSSPELAAGAPATPPAAAAAPAGAPAPGDPPAANAANPATSTAPATPGGK